MAQDTDWRRGLPDPSRNTICPATGDVVANEAAGAGTVRQWMAPLAPHTGEVLAESCEDCATDTKAESDE